MGFNKTLNCTSNIIIDDSLNSNLCGGNKIRKLRYILENKKNGYDGFLTMGSKFSNHCPATAYMGLQKSKKVRILITDEAKDISKYPNLQLSKNLGAELVFIGKNNLAEKIEDQKKKYFSYFWINGGGHCKKGFLAYRDWFKELIFKNPYLKKFENLILPFGTGTTTLGIAQAIFDLNLNIKTYGISVSRCKAKCILDSKKMVRDEVLNLVEVVDVFAGKYGKIESSQLSTRIRFFKKFGLFVDPIYNIRVAEYLERYPLEKCIIVNTGGQLNNLLGG